MRKIIEITALIIFIAGIHLAGADSGNFTDFLWSKVAAGGLMGLSALMITMRRRWNKGGIN